MPIIEDKEKAIQMLRNFRDSHQDISAVFEGVDPEDGSLTYHLLCPQKYDGQLEDEITDLDLRIARETGHICGIFSWPIPLERYSNYGFLGGRIC